MVNSLISLHLQNKSWNYWAVNPIYVPFRIFEIFIQWNMNVQCFSYISQYFILCVLQIYSQLGKVHIARSRQPLICNQLSQKTGFELVNQAISITVLALVGWINQNDFFSYHISGCQIKPLVCLLLKVCVCNQLCVCLLFLEFVQLHVCLFFLETLCTHT